VISWHAAYEGIQWCIVGIASLLCLLAGFTCCWSKLHQAVQTGSVNCRISSGRTSNYHL